MRDFLLGRPSGEAGFSIIEILIAGAILGFIAIALLPSMFSITDAGKATSFKVQCASIVRAKLQEYVNGVADATGHVPSGFEYTKRRYQANTSSCSLTAGQSAPGFRERVDSNSIVAANAGPESATAISDRLQGFRLFVMIRHYNPRVLTAAGQPSRACPTSDYQFIRVADALEVTVTGMIRTLPATANSGRGGNKFGSLEDFPDGDGDPENNSPNPQLTCTVTQVIYPPNIPFRYYLGLDGKLRSYQAQALFNASGALGSTQAAAMEAHFRSLWSSDASPASSNSPVVGSLKSLVVAPDNSTVYVLKPGVITRYNTCAETYTRVIDGNTFNGMPDCVLTDNATNRTEWTVADGIESIAVDFKSLTSNADDIVYGLLNSGATNVGGVGSLRQATLTAGAPGSTAWADPTTGIASIPLLPRIKGIFLGQTFPYLAGSVPNLYVIDNTCYVPPSGAVANYVYCVSVFNAADTNASLDVNNLPVQVQSVSY